MGEVIALFNQKGGVGKTTTCYNLAAGLSLLHGKKILLIDLDAQMNLTTVAGARKTDPETGRDESSILHMLTYMDGAPAKEAKEVIQKLGNFDFIIGNKKLAAAESYITKRPGEESDPEPVMRLKLALDPLRKKYDYICIDCPPNLGILTVCALVAADRLIIPSRVGRYSLDAIVDACNTVKDIQTRVNPKLKVDGVLVTQTQSRTLVSKGSLKSAEELAGYFNTKVFSTKIRFAEKDIEESTASLKSLFEYSPKANVTKDYEEFIKEFLEG